MLRHGSDASVTDSEHEYVGVLVRLTLICIAGCYNQLSNEVIIDAGHNVRTTSLPLSVVSNRYL